MSKNLPVNESDVKDGIKDVFKALEAWYYMPVQTGLGVGGIHDFIACVPITVTPEMVGKRIGLFVSVEAKEPGKVAKLMKAVAAGKDTAHLAKNGVFVSNRSLQTHQADAIHDAAGIALVSDSAAELRKALRAILICLREQPAFPGEHSASGLTECDMHDDESY